MQSVATWRRGLADWIGDGFEEGYWIVLAILIGLAFLVYHLFA